MRDNLRSSALRCATRSAAAAGSDVSLSSFNEVKGQYLTGIGAYESLVKDARKAGALPAWVRLGWDPEELPGWKSPRNLCRER